MSDNNSGGGGMGAVGLAAAGLTIVFAVFKLLGTLTWSWWWVLSPILIYVGIPLGLLAIILLAVFATWVATKISD